MYARIRFHVYVVLVCVCCLVASVSVCAVDVSEAPSPPESPVLPSVSATEAVVDNVGDSVSPDASGSDAGAPALRSIPSGALSGGYFFKADCVLGNGLTFYVPSDYATGALTFDSIGDVVNLTDGTIYLYCPDRDITVYASRFSTFVYRYNSSGHSYADINFHNVSSDNVSFLSDTPFPISTNTLLIVAICSVILFGCLNFCFRGRR